MFTDRNLVRLSTVAAKPQQWLWPGRIPLGAISLLEGDPGEGKSLLTYDLAARVTTGLAMPEAAALPSPSGVILLQAEDRLEALVKPRLEAANADIDRVLVYDQDRFAQKPLLLPEDVPLLEDAAAKVEAKLLVIDPLSAFLGGSVNSEQQVRRALAALQGLAERAELAVLLVRHLTKGRGASAMYRGSGSIGVIAAVRSALLAARDPGSEDRHRHVLVPVKSNVASAPSLAYRTMQKDGQLQLEWLGPSRFTSQDVTNHTPDDVSAFEEAMFRLYEILQGGPQWANDVLSLARKAGVAQRTLHRAKALLGVKSHRWGDGCSSRWAWQLPKEETELIRRLKARAGDELFEQLVSGDGAPAGVEPPEEARAFDDENAREDQDEYEEP
jgi:KaiC/GvpD/RAD55 family RecA-like ATPase